MHITALTEGERAFFVFIRNSRTGPLRGPSAEGVAGMALCQCASRLALRESLNVRRGPSAEGVT